jgi:hypothetical protein
MPEEIKQLNYIGLVSLILIYPIDVGFSSSIE